MLRSGKLQTLRIRGSVTRRFRSTPQGGLGDCGSGNGEQRGLAVMEGSRGDSAERVVVYQATDPWAMRIAVGALGFGLSAALVASAVAASSSSSSRGPVVDDLLNFAGGIAGLLVSLAATARVTTEKPETTRAEPQARRPGASSSRESSSQPNHSPRWWSKPRTILARWGTSMIPVGVAGGAAVVQHYAHTDVASPFVSAGIAASAGQVFGRWAQAPTETVVKSLDDPDRGPATTPGT